MFFAFCFSVVLKNEFVCFIFLCELRPSSSKVVMQGVIVEKKVYYVIVCV